MPNTHIEPITAALVGGTYSVNFTVNSGMTLHSVIAIPNNPINDFVLKITSPNSNLIFERRSKGRFSSPGADLPFQIGTYTCEVVGATIINDTIKIELGFEM